MSFPSQVSLYKNTSLNSNIPNSPPPPLNPPSSHPPITLPRCWGWGLTDVKCNGHSNGWPQGVAATHPLEKKQRTLFVRKLQAANQRTSLHLHNSRFARDHTVLFVVRSLLKASPQLHAHTMVDLLQTTPYSLPSDYTSDHFLWSQISAKIPSYHTFTQQQNHCRPPCCILCCQTTDQTLFSSSFNHSGTPKDSLYDGTLISKYHTIPEYHTTLKPITFKHSHLTAEHILADK